MNRFLKSHWAGCLGWLALFTASLGMMVIYRGFGYREFAKLKVGPLYILDALFLGWFFFASVESPRRVLSQIRASWVALLFCGWASVLLALDLIAQHGPAVPYQRILQHSVLFVYPALWMLAGSWLTARPGFSAKPIAWTLLIVSSLQLVLNVTLLPDGWLNISVGALAILPLMLLIDRAVDHAPNWSRRLRIIAAALVATILVFLPFWRMWLYRAQRTSMLILLVGIVLVPLILPDRKALRRAGIISGTLAFFVVGSATITIAYYADFKHGIFAQLAEQFFRSAQKGEDVPTFDGEERFQMRTRRYLWQTAISDWKESPWTGRGFVPEIPSSVRPGLPNVGGFESADAPPVAGPHNSYLTVLARTGIVGAALFALLFFVILWSGWRLASEAGLNDTERVFRLLLLFVPLNGFVHAFFNSGLESPQNCMLLWLFAGMCTGYARLERVKKRPALAG